MTTPTKEARQRCADLANEVRKERGNSPAFYAANCFGGGDMAESVAFARYVQQVSDTASEIVRLLDTPCMTLGQVREATGNVEALARTLILPEPPVDPLVEALLELDLSSDRTVAEHDAEWLRKTIAKQGKRIEIVEEG